MSDTTKIQWADATFNPWIGCTKVSPGCANCYAENTTRARVLRSQGHETWGKGKARSRTSAATWKNPVKWNQESEARRLRELHSVGFGEAHNFIRPRIFSSLCDWLDDEVPIEWLADFLKLIYETPNLDWLLLTKRPENWRRRVGEIKTTNEEFAAWLLEWLLCGRQIVGGKHDGYEPQPPHNIWIGTSIEDKPRKSRLNHLRSIPARVRFLSLEPLLEDLELKSEDLVGIHWAIAGGESGPKARPCNVEWVRSIVKQCKAAGVAPFVKQLGSKPICLDTFRGTGAPKDCSNLITDKKGGDMAEWPEDLRVREFPVISPRT